MFIKAQPHEVVEDSLLSYSSAGKKRETVSEAAAAVHPDHFHTPRWWDFTQQPSRSLPLAAQGAHVCPCLSGEDHSVHLETESLKIHHHFVSLLFFSVVFVFSFFVFCYSILIHKERLWACLETSSTLPHVSLFSLNVTEWPEGLSRNVKPMWPGSFELFRSPLTMFLFSFEHCVIAFNSFLGDSHALHASRLFGESPEIYR